MTKIQWIAASVLGTLLLANLAVTLAKAIPEAQAAGGQRIQYAVIPVRGQGPQSLVDPLDHWGGDGWDLVQFDAQLGALIFKKAEAAK